MIQVDINNNMTRILAFIDNSQFEFNIIIRWAIIGFWQVHRANFHCKFYNFRRNEIYILKKNAYNYNKLKKKLAESDIWNKIFFFSERNSNKIS